MAVPTKLLELNKTCLGKTSFDEKDIYRGDQLEVWVNPIPFGQELPNVYTITNAAEVAEDATIASLQAGVGETVTIYKGDVLFFPDGGGGGQMLVVSGTRTLTNTASDVPIYAQNTTIPISSTATTYGNIPCYSIETGAVPQSTGTIAESRNRGQNLFTVKAVYQRSATSSLEGTAIRNDASLALLENASQDNSRVYIETRRPPFDAFGAGFNAKKYKGILESSSPTSSASEHSKINFSVAITGAFAPYVPLGLTLDQLKALMPEDAYLANIIDNNC